MMSRRFHVRGGVRMALMAALVPMVMGLFIPSAWAYDETDWRHYWDTNSWFELYWDNGLPDETMAAWIAPGPAVVVVTNDGATAWSLQIECQADADWWMPEVRVFDGATMNVGEVNLGYSDHMTGYLLVSNATLNADPSIDSDAWAFLGSSGTGILEVVSGGLFTCRTMYLGRFQSGSSRGILRIRDNATCKISNSLRFGEWDNKVASTCEVDVRDNSLLSVADTFEIETTRGHSIVITNNSELRVNRLYFSRAPQLSGGGLLSFNEFTTVPTSFDMDVAVEMGVTGMSRSAIFNLQASDTVTMGSTFDVGAQKSATVNCTGTLHVADNMRVGMAETSSVNLVHGTNSVGGALLLSATENTGASYSNSSGNLEVDVDFYIGRIAQGSYSQSGTASALIRQSLYLGYVTGSEGACSINGGSMTVQSNIYIGAAMGIMEAPSTMDVAQGRLETLDTIYIRPYGTLRISGGTAVCQNITLNDNGLLNFSDGSLVVTGDYTQAASGTVEVSFTNETPEDRSVRIEIDGTATFDGTINIYANTSSVQPGMTYPVFRYSSCAGGFAATNIYCALPDHVSATLICEDKQVALRVAYDEDAGDSPAHYVSAGGTAVWPFTNWATAAHTIQDAVDAAAAGDAVWVTNGIYDTGVSQASGCLCYNRVTIEKAVTLQSVNGAAATFVVGASDNGGHGDDAVRGVYLGGGATMAGFTLTNGYTRTSGDQNLERGGGGALLLYGSVVSNCVFSGNRCDGLGAGADLHHGGTIYNSVLHGNRADDDAGGVLINGGKVVNCLIYNNDAADNGGGAYIYQNGTIINSTIAHNTCSNDGGGIKFYLSGTNNNCIVYNNLAGDEGDNWYVQPTGTMDYCCTTPEFSGAGNISDDPEFLNGSNNNYRLSASSPCINAGDNSVVLNAVDLDGNNRILKTTVDMGAYETGQEIWVTNSDDTVYGVITSYTVGGTNSAILAGSMWWTNALSASGTAFPAVTPWTVEEPALGFGENNLVVYGTNASGVLSYDRVTITRLKDYGPGSPMHYVSPDGANLYPYTNWQQAATVIQEAVDAASDSDTVLVTNGFYNTGGDVPNGQNYTSRVAMARNITLTSVNGCSNTFIVGASDNGTNGTLASRCLYMSGGSVSGFTITNGYTQCEGIYTYRCGGGVLLVSGATVSNCVISGCSAYTYGGGIILNYGGLVTDCIIDGNRSDDRGGGVCINGGLLDRCIVRNNYTGGNGSEDGGGLLLFYTGYVRNCLIIENEADDGGGGIYLASSSPAALVENCTIVSNTARTGGGIYTYGGSNRNCILYYNTATNTVEDAQNWQYGANSTSTFDNCCTVPLPTEQSTGCFTNDPDFQSGTDAWLSSNSPCVNTGTNQGTMAGTVDLNGVQRIVDDIVDVGACEWAAAPTYNGLLTAQTNALDDTLEYNLPGNAFSDPAGVGLVYTLILTNGSAAPDWLQIDPATGRIYGTADELGDQPLRIQVSDVLDRECYGDMLWRIMLSILADAGNNGSILPSGIVYVGSGGTTSFVMNADIYYHVDDVLVNGTSVGAATNWTVSGITSNETIHADFADDTAVHGTPHWWLAAYGLTNSGGTFDDAETGDPDDDAAVSWKEYVADTDPTNPASVFALTDIQNGPPLHICFTSSSNRLYTLLVCTNLVDSVWTNVPGQHPRTGAGGADDLTDSNAVNRTGYYSVDVAVPE